MPSGAKKRKAAKKKKAHDSSTTNPQQAIAGENAGGELSSPTPQEPLVEVVKREDKSSGKTSRNVNEEGSNVGVETVSKSKDSNGSSSSSSGSSDDESNVVQKKVVVLEYAPIESLPAIESLPEKISPIVDPVKPVDPVFDEMKNKGEKDLVVEETTVVEEKQKVDDCETAVKDDCLDCSVVVEPVLEGNEVEKLKSLVEKASSESMDCVSSSTPSKDLIPVINGADHPNEIETIEHSDRQAPADSTPVAVQNTTSWKSCCGIFELFSGSGR